MMLIQRLERISQFVYSLLHHVIQVTPPSYALPLACKICLMQDCMAVVRYGMHPDLFITMTTNPQWREILENLLPGQDATKRPDLTARVFKGKLQQLLTDLKKGQIFGRVVAKVHVIEFQKRGLPHAHILISFAAEHKLRGPLDFDFIVSAQLPDQTTHPVLYELVCKHMIHGDCGQSNPSAGCMRKGSCRFGYPKAFCEETSATDDAYPQYARRVLIASLCWCVQVNIVSQHS